MRTGFEPILSNMRINIFTKTRAYHFDLYRQAFDEIGGYFSPCKRVRVFRHRDSDDEIIQNQYSVFVNEKPVHSRQYSIAHSAKPRKARAGKKYAKPATTGEHDVKITAYLNSAR